MGLRSCGPSDTHIPDLVAVGPMRRCLRSQLRQGRGPAAAARVGTPWLWTLACGQHEDRSPTHGYEPTREAAMAAFAKSQRRDRSALRVGGPLTRNSRLGAAVTRRVTPKLICEGLEMARAPNFIGRSAEI
jgi:hypothetical protein